MPTVVYDAVKARLLASLRQYFKYADSPIPGPAKIDHGDVDIFVCEAFDEKYRDPATLAKIVGAKEWRRQGGGPIHLVVAWPEDTTSNTNGTSNSTAIVTESGEDTESSSASTASNDSSSITPQAEKKYIQLDITTLQSHTSYNWHLFFNSHSDLWPILGSLLKRYGLTARPPGLFIHIPEVLPHNRDKSLVKITDDPSLVLKYLELDEDTYWQGEFATKDDLCAYVATMKFTDLGREKRREMHQLLEAQEQQDAKSATVNGNPVEAKNHHTTNTLTIPQPDSAPSSTSLTPMPSRTPTPNPTTLSEDASKLPIFTDKYSGLKNNDRRRLSARPLFEYYHSIYVPAHSTVDTPPNKCAKMSKEEVLDDVKTFFGQEFAEKYDEQRKQGVKQVLEIKFWADVKSMIKEEGAEGAELGYGCKGVRSLVVGDEKWVWSELVVGEGEFVLGGVEKGDEKVGEYRRMRESWRELRYEEVMGYVRLNWRVAGAVQRARDEKESARKRAEKREREEKKAEEPNKA
jgi:hypothetical protein